MFSANVDHDGDRYGFVRNMKDAQDEYNHRRSKALHQINSRRLILVKARFRTSRRFAGNGRGLMAWSSSRATTLPRRQGGRPVV
jgi:hypothetical protein